ncbi:hypothetical protein LTS08_000188 [Lithohypha guttulata]|uniref:uncharacterized protein n=1 Tax=Lithohypha guttulata TaxID=1690604 RepID=UPI002DDFD036|nr:hypothetical protein LTR51_007187 [Lithohypha guttulata]KAK5106072.1 hypothetical protein LTS08_000188 [Lithohypha guttulata]
MDEDCLALNVVRPAGSAGQKLPVAVWIHGGGYIMGGATDRRYNLSFIVQNSVDIGKPIIAVSIPYRLSAWGFIDSQEVRSAGITNIGMQDQRQALYWIQENIAAFGGDPTKVTIWGESAGAGSVGIHLIAYGGRDDKLFSGAICESGNSILLGSQNYNVSDGQAIYNNITTAAGCSGSADTLSCLRAAPFDRLNAAINITRSYGFYPYQDGTLIQGSQYDQLNNGNFIKVPLLSGANTDEGASFGPRGINNDSAFATYLTNTGRTRPLNASTVAILQAVYPNLPAASDVLYSVPLDYQYNSTYGFQFRRAVAFGGDLAFHAARRLQCQSWAMQNVSAYCYRFNAIPYPLPNLTGSVHFQEVAFVFNNLQGLGYAFNPFQGQPQSYVDLSSLMSRMWASFVHDGNPNGHGLQGYQQWPAYDVVSGGGVGYDYFFDANTTSRPEKDSWRAEGIAYLNTLWKTVYGR